MLKPDDLAEDFKRLSRYREIGNGITILLLVVALPLGLIVGAAWLRFLGRVDRELGRREMERAAERKANPELDDRPLPLWSTQGDRKI